MTPRAEPIRHRRRRAQTGSALLVVLLMLGMIAALAAVVSRSVSGAALEMSAAQLTARRESNLRAGIELGAAAILKLGETMRSAEASLSLPGRRIQVRITNERARIDLNTASPMVLTALLVANGVIENDAIAMAQSVIEWRGGSASQQLAAPTADEWRLSTFAKLGSMDPRPEGNLRKAPQQTIGTRFFLHPIQLASVPGFSIALVNTILPLVTVANGSNLVDPYIASPAVLRALPGVTPATVDAFLSSRDGNAGRELALKLLGIPEALVSSSAAAGWRLQISVDEGARTYRCEAVVAVLEGDTEPYRVLYVLDGQ